MTRPNRRAERLLFAAVATGLTGLSAGLATLLFQLTKRHGEMLLELESLRDAPGQTSSPRTQDMREYLFEHGAPPGSVAMNFELRGVDGEQYTFTRLKRDRTMLIFIAPDCERSRGLLDSLARLPIDLDQPHFRIALISTGTMAENESLARSFNLHVPLLVQERDEVDDLYYVTGTPMAYVFGPNSVTESDRLAGSRAILGAAIAALSDASQPPDDVVRPLPPPQSLEPTALRAGDELPAFRVERLCGGTVGRADFLGQRTLLVMFDPLCGPCLDLLPDLDRMHADRAQPSVIMITRRDAGLTQDLLGQREVSYPVGRQDNWEISRLLGVLAVPAACIVDQDGFLESNIATGRQAVVSLARQAVTGPPLRRLVALTSWLRGR